MRLLDALRLKGGWTEAHELAIDGRRVLRPQAAHGVHVLVGDRTSRLVGNFERGELRRRPTGPDDHLQPASRGVINRRQPACAQRWMPIGNDHGAVLEADPSGPGGQVREDDHGVEIARSDQIGLRPIRDDDVLPVGCGCVAEALRGLHDVRDLVEGGVAGVWPKVKLELHVFALPVIGSTQWRSSRQYCPETPPRHSSAQTTKD